MGWWAVRYLLSSALLELPRAFVYATTLYGVGCIMTDMNTAMPYPIFGVKPPLTVQCSTTVPLGCNRRGSCSARLYL